MPQLIEDRRADLLSKQKAGKPYAASNQQDGKNRYARRTKSKFSRSVRSYNNLDMNGLFKTGILTVNIQVTGETDEYIVTIKFGDFLQQVQRSLRQSNTIDLRVITRALINAFNGDDVYVHCTCPDWKYRFAYWGTVNDINSGETESRPSNITNPEDDKGPGCKHVALVLANTTWLIKVASVINNYINYMQKYYPQLYADIIYPALYDEEYQDPVQLQLDNTSAEETVSVPSQQDDIDVVNKWAKTRGQFQRGNDSGIRFTKSPNKQQLHIDDLISDTN